jgi:hypothetical protein
MQCCMLQLWEVEYSVHYGVGHLMAQEHVLGDGRAGCSGGYGMWP